MKTLILYASKYGAAKEIAGRIAKKIDGSVIYDLKQGNIPPLSQFGCVILGSSVYAGSIRKEAKAFLEKNAGELSGRKLGLFLSGFSPDNDFAKVFPPKVLQAAKAKANLGGIFDPGKAGAAERFIIKIVMKQTEYTDTISNEQITRFVGDLDIY